MDNYEKLRQILDSHPSGAPRSRAFDEILHILFTPDEVEIALHMNFSPKPVNEISEAIGLTMEEAEKRLEAMADKVIIFSQEKDGIKYYGLVPTIPGLFEFPFMQGGGTPFHEKLAQLWQEYHGDGLGKAFAGNPTPMMRVVPVERDLEAQTEVLPYESASELIEQQTYIAVTNCACRVSVGACDRPIDVCLIFGSPAKFLVRRERAREITKEEALAVLRRAEEAGLVHTTNNSTDRATLICNCCPCCCTILRGKTQLNLPYAFLTSSFLAQVDADLCIGCGICADERCPMEAIRIEDDIAYINKEKCIGCGLCETKCPVDAITLIKRPEIPEIPATLKDMAAKVLTEKGKLERFIEVMRG